MKKAILIGAMLVVRTSFCAQAQATNSTNAPTVSSAATNNPGVIGNDRIERGKMVGSKPNRSGATLDGSNGSATNDGASGLSGAPAPLPAATTPQSVNKNSGGSIHKSKSSRKSSVTSKTRRG